MVELISKVEDLEEQVLELNGELTETQANEAILEADLNSFKVLLDRTSKAFLQEKERADMLDRENLDLRETNKKLKEELSDIRLEIDHIGLELVTEKGKVGEYSAENGEIKILNAELIVSLSEVRLEQEHTQHELAEEREISEAREVENQESKEYSERLEIEISQLKFEVESINRLLQDEKTKMTLTGTENAKLKAVNSQLNNQINETKAKVQQLNHELNAEKSKSQTLATQLTESTTNFIPTELKLLEKSKKILQNWLIISNHSLQKLITIHNLSNPVIEDHHYEITNENYAEYLSQTIACQKQTYNTITGLQFDLNVKISFNKYFLLISFKIGSVCLFLPTKTLGIIAFHINCPGYYLDVTEKFKQRAKKREWIIGVIERIEERVGDGIEVEMGKRYYLCDAKPFRE
jgi:chromosome segregation ATPase